MGEADSFLMRFCTKCGQTGLLPKPGTFDYSESHICNPILGPVEPPKPNTAIKAAIRKWEPVPISKPAPYQSLKDLLGLVGMLAGWLVVFIVFFLVCSYFPEKPVQVHVIIDRDNRDSGR
jgi:hypothetical protein